MTWLLAIGVATYSWVSTDSPSLFTDMRAQGMSVVRLTVVRSRAVHDLGVLREELPVAKANGVSVVVNLTDEPDAPTSGFAAWAGRAAKSLPEVRRFIIGNEVNAHRFWRYGIKAYVRMLGASRAAIWAARPDALVSGFALDSTHKPVAYLKKAYLYGLPMDTLSIHAYASPARMAYLIKGLRRIWAGPITVDEASYTYACPLLPTLYRLGIRVVLFYRFRPLAC